MQLPSPRNGKRTSITIATLMDMVQHYSELNEDRLHAESERLLRALRPTPGEIDDLVMFLRSLSVVERDVQ